MAWLSIILIFSVPPIVLMGLAFLVGIRQWWGLMLAAILGGMFAGMFIFSAAAAMASAVDPNEALLRGALVGSGAGIVIGGLILLLARLVSGIRGR